MYKTEAHRSRRGQDGVGLMVSVGPAALDVCTASATKDYMTIHGWQTSVLDKLFCHYVPVASDSSIFHYYVYRSPTSMPFG